MSQHSVDVVSLQQRPLVPTAPGPAAGGEAQAATGVRRESAFRYCGGKNNTKKQINK